MRQLIEKLARLIGPSETIDGYQHPELVDVHFRKTLAYRPLGKWRDTAGAATVLDFGGACGRHYKEAQSATVRWAVVDTPAMVARAKELSTDRLQFFTDISEAAEWLGPIDVMHSNGALQYTPDPSEVLHQLCGLRARKMLWYRLLLGEGRDVQTSYLGDNGPGSIPIKEKLIRYERAKIPETEFLAAHQGYSLSGRGPDWFTFTI